jgi:ParB family chromosome partitioning protein
LTVRDVEEAVRARAELEQAGGEGDGDAPASRPKSPARSRQREPGVLELEELLADFLETRVAIQGRGGRGKVVIEYADLEDLERIYRRIAAGPTV